MNGLIKIIITFILSIICFTLSVVAFKMDESSPYACILGMMGVVTFAISLTGFLLI